MLGVNGFGVDCAGKPGGGRSTLPRPFGATSGDISGPEAVTVVVVAVLASPTDGDSGMDGIVALDLWRTLTDRVLVVLVEDNAFDLVLSPSLSELSLSGSSVWSVELSFESVSYLSTLGPSELTEIYVS